MPSITGSTLIFLTTLHTTWQRFLLPCGPTLHIGTVFLFSVSKKDRYSKESLLPSDVYFALFYYLFERHILCRLARRIPCSFLGAGTFITEWNDGAVTCEAFLKDEESYRAVADRLVQICYCYGFDGWLINIENALSVSQSLLLVVTMVTPKQKQYTFPFGNPCCASGSC